MQTQTAIRAEPFRRPVSRHASSMPELDPRGEAGSLEQSMRLMGAMISYPRDTEIFGENEPAEYVYKVISGSVRTYKILADGRRQIGGISSARRYLRVAIGRSACAFGRGGRRRKSTRGQAQRPHGARRPGRGDWPRAFLPSPAANCGGCRIAFCSWSRAPRSASQASFWKWRSAPRAGNTVELPMSRQDIADYLGLTIETVSRTLTTLETAAAIEVPTSRRIVLRNRSALNRLNS